MNETDGLSFATTVAVSSYIFPHVGINGFAAIVGIAAAVLILQE